MRIVLAWGGFGLALCLIGWLIDDGLGSAIYLWTMGLAMVVASIITLIARVIRYLAAVAAKGR